MTGRVKYEWYAGFMNTTTTIKGMDMVGLSTNKSRELIAFYRDVLGLQPTNSDDEGTAAEFELADGTTLGIWNPPDPSYLHPGGSIMFAVPDAKAAVEELRARGAQIGDVMESSVCFLAPGKDPEGNPFVIHQRKT